MPVAMVGATLLDLFVLGLLYFMLFSSLEDDNGDFERPLFELRDGDI